MPKAKILAVEDEGIVALSLKRSLERLGYAVSAVVATGEEAIIKAAEHHLDLVLMDIMLQGEMDGIEAANQIRSTLHIPVVYLTAYADEKIVERAKHTEPLAYILKPFQERGLAATIEMALHQHKTMQRRLSEISRKASDELEHPVKERPSDLGAAHKALQKKSTYLKFLLLK